MPSRPSVTEVRLRNVTTCMTIAAGTLEILADNFGTPFLEAICNTTQSLLKFIQTVKQNKEDCIGLMEQAHEVLNAIIIVHLKSDTGGELPPHVLKHVGLFTETLHKIHAFVEAQQKGSRIKMFLRQGEMSLLLKECRAGLQQGLALFQIQSPNLTKDITKMQEDAKMRHKEVLNMIEALSDSPSSDEVSSISRVYSGSHSGAHLGLKPGKDLTHLVIQYFTKSPSSLLVLDNLETLWEPTQCRGNIEEVLSLLTDVDHLALVPLQQDAAQKIFIDIADSMHNSEEVDQILSLTDNLPLAINLMAHLVESEGCSTVLSRWEKEKTSLISDGYHRKSNLDFSILLSLSSPRLDSFPHSTDLLSLLSMLPDGLSDVELVQSKLPIDNILGCKAALLRTTLAYSDDNKRLKALVPIREYMQQNQPPGDSLIQLLLKHFQGLLEFYMEYIGTDSSPGIIARVSSNYLNIQNVLHTRLKPGHPDLKNSIYCSCYLNRASQLIGYGGIDLMNKIHNILPQLHDHHLEAYCIVELLNSWYFHVTSDRETLVSKALEHFKHFNDPDLESKFYEILAGYSRVCCDIPTAKKYNEIAIALALSAGNAKVHAGGLKSLAWINWHLGDYSTAQILASEAQRVAQISADLYREAQALNVGATCNQSLGNYKQSLFLCDRARNLLSLCGLTGHDTDHEVMITQAEIHKLKLEYVDAHNINTRILQETATNMDVFLHAFTLLNVADIEVFMGASKDDVDRNCDAARKLFNSLGYVTGATICDTILAALCLREGDLLAAKTIFNKCIKSSVGDPEIMSYCLERLGDISHWTASDLLSSWTTVFLVHSVRLKEKLGILKALQFIGDVFLAQGEEYTAINLFTVALDGFTVMDVHRNRAECMLRLAEISKEHNDLLKAVEFWETARPLFEQSSQSKQVEYVDECLAGVGKDVLEQHRLNLARLAELNVPFATVEDEDDLSDIKDMERLDLDDEKEFLDAVFEEGTFGEMQRARPLAQWIFVALLALQVDYPAASTPPRPSPLGDYRDGQGRGGRGRRGAQCAVRTRESYAPRDGGENDEGNAQPLQDPRVGLPTASIPSAFVPTPPQDPSLAPFRITNPSPSPSRDRHPLPPSSSSFTGDVIPSHFHLRRTRKRSDDQGRRWDVRGSSEGEDRTSRGVICKGEESLLAESQAPSGCRGSWVGIIAAQGNPRGRGVAATRRRAGYESCKSTRVDNDQDISGREREQGISGRERKQGHAKRERKNGQARRDRERRRGDTGAEERLKSHGVWVGDAMRWRARMGNGRENEGAGTVRRKGMKARKRALTHKRLHVDLVRILPSSVVLPPPSNMLAHPALYPFLGSARSLRAATAQLHGQAERGRAGTGCYRGTGERKRRRNDKRGDKEMQESKDVVKVPRMGAEGSTKTEKGEKSGCMREWGDICNVKGMSVKGMCAETNRRASKTSASERGKGRVKAREDVDMEARRDAVVHGVGKQKSTLVLTNFVLAVVHRKEDRCSVPFFHANSKCRLCVGAVVLYAGVDDGSKVCQRKEVLVVSPVSLGSRRNKRAEVAARLGTRA
ncbi:hypothetical protein B0H13DRAFT_2483243 [Mycena leptocephala]|nr:hypothetical protein B0H13DRAFT_2483243 [Mycena leptocephala]